MNCRSPTASFRATPHQARKGHRPPSSHAKECPGTFGRRLRIATFEQARSDPGAALTDASDRGNRLASTEANPSTTYTSNGTYEMNLTASDGKIGHETKRITSAGTACTIYRALLQRGKRGRCIDELQNLVDVAATELDPARWGYPAVRSSPGH